MPIVKRQMKNRYTIIPNDILLNSQLELQDIGLLCYMLMLPDGWQFSLSGLEKALPKTGRDKIRSIIMRLELSGYLVRSRERKSNGKLGGTIWTVYDYPMLDSERKNKTNYYGYILSEEWGKKRKQRMIIDKFTCQECGETKNLNVHHLTYEHLGNEPMEDLITLCEKCHKKIHSVDKTENSCKNNNTKLNK